MRIACDIDGGDHAPEIVVESTIMAANKWPQISFTLLGNSRLSQPLPNNVSYQVLTQTILSDDDPIISIRNKKDSSLVVGCKMLKEGIFDAFISAGNTGALMAAGMFYTGRMKGISRPALAPVFPTTDDRQMLVLDIGANADAKPEHLRQYALLGSIYAAYALGNSTPRVGLLNIGTEPNKGNVVLREAYNLLAQEPNIHFVGNIEARDVLNALCDVLVCDGLNGNILLKTMEGTAGVLFSALRDAFTSSLSAKVAASMLKSKLKALKHKMDYRRCGGVPLLGISGLLIKAHGSSDTEAFFNAINQAQRLIEIRVIDRLIEKLPEVDI